MKGHNWGLCRTCGKTHKHVKGFLNKRHTEEYKRKLHTRFAGEMNPQWKGGRRLLRGYVCIYKPNHPNATKLNYVLEHRLVMENKLGRYLTKKEVVHHINEKRYDNRIENLELFKDLKTHSLIKHTKGIIYGRFKKESP